MNIISIDVSNQPEGISAPADQIVSKETKNPINDSISEDDQMN